jgi:hypothetical protein
VLFEQCPRIVAQLFTGKNCAQSELAISILPARTRAIRGDRANGLTQKNALGTGGDGKHFVVHADEKLTAAGLNTGLVSGLCEPVRTKYQPTGERGSSE